MLTKMFTRIAYKTRIICISLREKAIAVDGKAIKAFFFIRLQIAAKII